MPSINDQKRKYYAALLGVTTGSLADLERTYFGATTTQSLDDAKRTFFGAFNGSSPLKGRGEEEFLYYSSMSGLTPVRSYSLADHTKAVFESGGPVPLLTNLQLWLDADQINGKNVALPADGTVVTTWKDISGNGRDMTQASASLKPVFRNASPNLLTYNQATVETDTTGIRAGVAAPTIARSVAQAKSGTASLQITATSTAGLGVECTNGTSIVTSIIAGRLYTASVSCRANATTRSFRCLIQWWDVNKALISNSTGSNVTNSAAAWNTATVSAVAPANAVYGTCIIEILAVNNTEIHFADEFMIREGSDATWFAPVDIPTGRCNVQFDGLDDFMTLGSLVNIANPYSIYVVAKIDANRTADNSVLIDAHTTSAGTNRAVLIRGAGSFFAANAIVSTIPYDTNRHVQVLIGNGASSVLSIDGATTSGTQSVSFDMATIGRRFAAVAGAIWPGTIASVLIYTGAHTSPQRVQIERWLGSKYGITVA